MTKSAIKTRPTINKEWADIFPYKNMHPHPISNNTSTIMTTGSNFFIFLHFPVFRGLHHECLEAILRKS